MMKSTHVITTSWATHLVRRLDDCTFIRDAGPPFGPAFWNVQRDGSLLCDGDPYPDAKLFTAQEFTKSRREPSDPNPHASADD